MSKESALRAQLGMLFLLLNLFLPYNCYYVCPRGWSRIKDTSKCLKVKDDKEMTWYNARAYCQGLGGDLLTIKDEKKQNSVKAIISKMRFYDPPSPLWIGLKGRPELSYDSLAWPDEKLPPRYTHWQDGKPDSNLGEHGCGVLSPRFTYHWDDVYCGSNVAYPACERQASVVTTTMETPTTKTTTRTMKMPTTKTTTTATAMKTPTKTTAKMKTPTTKTTTTAMKTPTKTTTKMETPTTKTTTRTMKMPTTKTTTTATAMKTPTKTTAKMKTPTTKTTTTTAMKTPTKTTTKMETPTTKTTTRTMKMPTTKTTTTATAMKTPTKTTAKMKTPTTATTTTTTIAGDYDCPKGWRWIKGTSKCLKVLTEYVTDWFKAQKYCKFRQGDLLTIRDAKTQNSVADIFGKSLFYNYLWIGLKALPDHSFAWLYEKTPIGYSAWFPGRPNLQLSTYVCGFLWMKENFQWGDIDCYAKAHPVCEHPAISRQPLGVETFVEGEDLVVTCNADAVGLEQSFTQISAVALNHVADDQEKTQTLVAYIRQKNGLTDQKGSRETGLDFYQWTFDMPTPAKLHVQLPKDNRQTMTIRATKTNAKCKDGGVFRCIVVYVDNWAELSRERSTNYTGRGLIRMAYMTVSWTGFLGNTTYGENSTLTFNCRADGPENFEFRWHKRCPSSNVTGTPQFVSWPNPNDIQEKRSVLRFSWYGRGSDCGTYRHTQNLVFNALLEDNNCEIRCQFGNVQSGFNAHSKTRTILMKGGDVSNQQQGVETFVEGEDLVVTCNVDTVGLDNSFTLIHSVVLYHVADDQNNSEREVALIKQRNGHILGFRRTAPAFNQWTFALPSQDMLDVQLRDDNNRETMTIKATKTNVKCKDGGVFKCIVRYIDKFDMDLSEREKSTNYLGGEVVLMDDMTVSSTEYLDNNTYGENSTLTFTCRADGPENYEFRWHKRCPSANVTGTSQFVSWPNPNDIAEKTSTLKLDENGQKNDCQTYKHTQSLVFNALLEDNNCDIRCQFGSVQSDFNAHSKTRTILVKRDSDDEDAFSCPCGWNKVPGKDTCFRVYKERRSWADSRKFCQSQGAELMTITDYYTNIFIPYYVHNEVKEDIWVGATAQSQSTNCPHIKAWLNQRTLEGKPCKLQKKFACELLYNTRK